MLGAVPVAKQLPKGDTRGEVKITLVTKPLVPKHYR
jgi:hypothetical protein